jgi:tRNA pseudouridine38-40 synthase
MSYLQNKSSWFFPIPLDIEKMSSAANHLLGTHDFNAFRSIHCQSKKSVRSIDSISIKKQQKLISMRIKGKSFLHNQIRIIVGSIVMVGEGKWDINKIKSVLESKDRKTAGPTAPPHGLYLEKIIY